MSAFLATDSEAIYTELTPEQGATFLKNYNDSAPPTGFQYDRVGFFSKPGFPLVSVMMGMNECLWYSLAMPAETLKTLIDPVSGTPLNGARRIPI